MQLRRNFIMGRLVRTHLAGLAGPQGRGGVYVRGCGGLIATNLDLASTVHFSNDRLLLPWDLTSDEVFQCMTVKRMGILFFAG